mgnify:FL=1
MRRLVVGYLRLARPSTSISTLLTSIASSVSYDNPLKYIDPLSLALLYLGVFLSHVAVNIFNDYFDYRSGIDLYTVKTSFSGGSKAIVEGIVSASETLYMATITLFSAALIGLYLTILRGLIVLILMIIGAVIVVGYTLFFTKIGLGELSIYLKGVFVSLGSFYVVYQKIDLLSLIIGSVYGLSSVIILFINSVPDRDIDKIFGRRNLVIISQENKLWIIYVVLIGLLMMNILILSLYIDTLIFYIYLILSIGVVLFMSINALYLKKVLSINELFVNRLSKLSNAASINIFSLRVIEFLTVYVFIIKNFLFETGG